METSLIKMDFSEDQVKLIKDQVAKDSTDNELKLFLYQCKRTGLDPLTRQIYFMKRSGKMTIQTSIDGFRVIAERSGDYAGQDEPEFITEDGKLTCAKIRVYRFKGDTRYCASVGVAYMSEYKPQDGQAFMWNKMPHTMLAKVAEALALRKAYPQDLSGL
jgi:phage recombination protein Bet